VGTARARMVRAMACCELAALGRAREWSSINGYAALRFCAWTPGSITTTGIAPTGESKECRP